MSLFLCYSRTMNTTSTAHPPKKRGRKSLGASPMSEAERKRRSREQMRAAGAREFMLRLEGLHLQYVEGLAHAKQISATTALHGLVEAALDRFVGVMRRCEEMRKYGASDESCAAFIEQHLFPALPAIKPKEEPDTQ